MRQSPGYCTYLLLCSDTPNSSAGDCDTRERSDASGNGTETSSQLVRKAGEEGHDFEGHVTHLNVSSSNIV